SLVFSGLTIGHLASSLVSTAVGKAIDTKGARFVMSLGSVLCAFSLLIVAAATHPAVYLAGWAIMGLGMRMSLYDAAFAALVQVAPHRGRRAISYLTLCGGFASSIFWPIGHILTAEVGWRLTLVIYAAINIAVCLPLHWCGLSRREPAESRTAETSSAAASPGVSDPPLIAAATNFAVWLPLDWCALARRQPAESRPAETSSAAASPGVTDPPLEGQARLLAIVLFGFVMAASAFVFGAMAVHLPAEL